MFGQQQRSITEWILRNADDVVQIFFDRARVAVDYKDLIGDWLFKNVPNLTHIGTAMKELEDIGAYALESKAELLKDPKNWRYVRRLNWVGEQLGFVDHKSPTFLEWFKRGTPKQQIVGPDIQVFWDNVLPVLAKNKYKISEDQWKSYAFKNAQDFAAGGIIPERTIYNIVKDHIIVNQEAYKVGAGATVVATIAGAVAYYLYKLYRSGVTPPQVQSKVIEDSQAVRYSAAKATKTKSISVGRRTTSRKTTAKKTHTKTSSSIRKRRRTTTIK